MKTKKQKKNPLKNNLIKPETNAAGKAITVGPEEYEEDLSVEIRMKPQPLNLPTEKTEEKNNK
jgi:hypothetical protein